MGGVAEAIGRARRFVATHGTGLDRVALAAALEGRAPGTAAEAPPPAPGPAPRAALAEALGAAQREDGAFPAAVDTEGPVAATARALAALHAAGLGEHPVAEAAVGFLCHAQDAEGGFADPQDADADARLARTGQVAALLSRSAFARASVLRAAEAWLRAAWSVERVQGGEARPLLAFLCALSSLPSELSDEALQWCGRELERGFRTGTIGAVDAARAFLGCGALALPGARLEAAEVVASLLAAQEADGGFAGPDLRERLDATRDAAVALALLTA